MSHSQFHSTSVILRHAWLNLWDKHMTTGRINQFNFLFIFVSHWKICQIKNSGSLQIPLDFSCDDFNAKPSMPPINCTFPFRERFSKIWLKSMQREFLGIKYQKKKKISCDLPRNFIRLQFFANFSVFVIANFKIFYRKVKRLQPRLFKYFKKMLFEQTIGIFPSPLRKFHFAHLMNFQDIFCQIMPILFSKPYSPTLSTDF